MSWKTNKTFKLAKVPQPKISDRDNRAAENRRRVEALRDQRQEREALKEVWDD